MLRDEWVSSIHMFSSISGFPRYNNSAGFPCAVPAFDTPLYVKVHPYYRLSYCFRHAIILMTEFAGYA